MAELAEAETENPHMHLCTFVLYCIGNDTVAFWERPVKEFVQEEHSFS